MLLHAFALSTQANTVDTSGRLTVKKDPAIYLRLNEVNLAAARDFVERFPDMTEERWVRASYGFSARFEKNDVISKVNYNHAGYFISSLRYYSESNIPAKYMKTLLRKCGNYTIIGATELTNKKETAFYIHIKNKRRVKTVKVYEDFVEVVTDFRNPEHELH